MLRSVVIQSPRKAKALLRALEQSEAVSRKEVVLDREVQILTREQVAELFTKKTGR
jgi:hypothetical protein